MKQLWWSWMLVSLLSGCGLFASDGPNAHDRSASLHVANRSDLTVCDLRLAPRGQQHWGEDRLTEEQRIPPEESETFYVAAGRWAVRMSDCRGRTLFVKRNLQLTGARRLDFRPVEVQRHPRFGARRFANDGRGRPRPM